MARALALVTWISAIGLLGCAKKADPADAATESAPGSTGSSEPSDRDRAQGVWKVTKLEWPKDSGALAWLDGIKSATVKVEGNLVTVATTVPTAGEAFSGDSEFSFAFEELKAPRVNLISTAGPGTRTPRTRTTFTVTKDGERVPKEVPVPPLRGLYKFEGEVLVVAVAVEPGADRPTVFEAGRVKVPEGLGNESAVLLVHLKKK